MLQRAVWSHCGRHGVSPVPSLPVTRPTGVPAHRWCVSENGPNAWIRIDPHGPYFLADGARWFPSGWCCAQIDVLTAHDLVAMAEAGCNTLRVWPDPNETGVISARLPGLLEDCEAAGLRCLVTLLNPGELSDLFIEGPPNLKRVKNAYREVCAEPEEILSSSAARQISRSRIDQYLDLVGDSPAVFAWEVGNQVDGVYQASANTVESWTAEMTEYVGQEEQRRFGGQRLRCVTSFDPLPTWDAAYRSPFTDFVALHCYSPSVYAPVDSLQSAWEIALTLREARTRSPHHLPIYSTEYGPLLHLFLPDYPVLPEDVLCRWRRNTAIAHLCAGGAGGPLIIPPFIREYGDNTDVTNVIDQIRPIPRTLQPPLYPEERAFRRILADPILESLDPDPVPWPLPAGTLGIGSGQAEGGVLLWIAADSRLLERRRLFERHLDGDPAVSPILAYDAGRALLEACDMPLWNPQSRIAVGKLMRQGIGDVAHERTQAEVRKLLPTIRRLDLGGQRQDLGGLRLSLPWSGGPRTFRCYDPSTGELALTGIVNGELELPALPEAVLALDPASARAMA